MAKLRHEELERQTSADLILAKKKHEIALRGKQRKLRMLEEELREEEMSRLEREMLDEENRRKITEAKLKEAEMEDAINHRVFSQAVQNTATGNHNPLTSVSQSQLPLMNPYARPFQP